MKVEKKYTIYDNIKNKDNEFKNINIKKTSNYIIIINLKKCSNIKKSQKFGGMKMNKKGNRM